MHCSNNSSCCVCIVVKAVRLQPALLNDQLCCVLSQPGEFWQHLPQGWQKSAYRDGRVHYHLLITGGFSGVFITCVDQGCVSSWVRRGVTVTLAELQGVSLCVCVQGLPFQLCCRLSTIFMSSLRIRVLSSPQTLPLKLPHQTTVNVPPGCSDNHHCFSTKGPEFFYSLELF